MWPSVDAVCDSIVRVAHRVPTKSENASAMKKSYAAFRRVYPASKTIFSA
jgi:hypothetical protein